jgi:hypothetical protein
MADPQRLPKHRLALGPRSKLKPHFALAVYALLASLTTWAAFSNDALGHQHFVSFYDVTCGIVEFYLFLILSVINYRHDFLPIGKLVLYLALLLCLSLSLYIVYQFVMTLRSPAYKTIFLGTIVDQRGYVTYSVMPLAAATAAFVAAMLFMTRVGPRGSRAKSPAIIAIDPVTLNLEPETFDALPLDASLPAGGAQPPGPFQKRRSADKPEIRDEGQLEDDWAADSRQTRN